MWKIQDFQQEKGTLYHVLWLAQFVVEIKDAFTKWQLVVLYMSKQEKHIQQMAHLQLLFIHGVITTNWFKFCHCGIIGSWFACGGIWHVAIDHDFHHSQCSFKVTKFGPQQ
jgi:hypothetical protein